MVHIWGLTPHLATKCSSSLREVLLYPSWGHSRSLVLRLKDASVSVGQAVLASTKDNLPLPDTSGTKWRPTTLQMCLCSTFHLAICSFTLFSFSLIFRTQKKTQIFREKTGWIRDVVFLSLTADDKLFGFVDNELFFFVVVLHYEATLSPCVSGPELYWDCHLTCTCCCTIRNL